MRGNGKDLEGAGAGEMGIRISCMKKIVFN